MKMIAAILLFLSSFPLRAQESGINGYWREPSGSVLRIEPCGEAVCAVIVQISDTAPTRVDARNPDPILRTRSLCGLRIGYGFKRQGDTRATEGTLYDPKSGKTYRGSLESQGNRLNLRGYVGFAFIGRTEKWTRTAAAQTCAK